jgi:homopolymeric O-antigen transport system ATP-binding protein
MSSRAIEVEGLGKQYRIGASMPAYRTLRDSIADMARGRRERPSREMIWALRDVSFEVEQGRAIGVIGANGAGKTTLLKILSRITEPTAGEARVCGLVGSLLEVGTGFHPELTGRENTYLNGAILGMPRREITRKFDEIVSFAGVEKFIDTPVKRYSSGMYVRLAFAVAAHLDSDILLVDEVLSVGDFGFQRRCLGKMQEQTSAEGRTVLFVSHNLASVKMLTERCLWLDKGRIQAFGPTDEVFRRYVASHGESTRGGFVDLSDVTVGRPRGKQLGGELCFESLELIDAEGRRTDTHLSGDPITFRIQVRATQPVSARVTVRCLVSTVEGVVVFSTESGPREAELEPGVYEITMALDPSPLQPGTYTVELDVVTMSDYAAAASQDLLPTAATFHVEDNPAFADERFAILYERRGLVRVDGEWSPLAEAHDPTGELDAALPASPQG